MPQIPNLSLLISNPNCFLLSSPLRLPSSLFFVFKPRTNFQSVKPFSIFSSFKKHNKRYYSKAFTPTHTSLIEKSNNKEGTLMEDNASFEYNRKRAAGRDKDKPKNLQLKVRKLNPINTICYVQILGTGMDTQDTSPSVLLFFDKQRFIFNCGEGLQRFCTEHRIKLSKIDHIFLTRVCSETAGGLPGLLLTLAGMGDEGFSVNAWGPSEFKYLVDAMKSFIPNAAMVHTHSFGDVPQLDGAAKHDLRKMEDAIVLIEDEVVKISAILLQSVSPAEPCPKHTADKLSERLQTSQNRTPDVKLKPGDVSVIYVCELPEIKGKFDTKKAVALGLRPGPKYRELQLGNSVKSDNQDIMVHPCDVLGPSILGPIVLLVDCPTLSHMHHLLSMQSLDNYYTDSSCNNKKNSRSVTCVIHLSPALVVQTSDYQMWMSRFGDAQHIMAGHEMKNIEIPILRSSARIAARLNYLCPRLFPAPGYWSVQDLISSTLDSKASCEGGVPKICESISAENLMKFILRPYGQLGLDRSGVPPTVAPSEIISELLSEIPETAEAAHHVAEFWSAGKESRGETVSVLDNKLMIEEPWLNEDAIPSCLEDVTREEMEIVLLGTGSAQPSKYRNVSSVYVNLFSKGSLLLDCGEGTLGQLKRRFGVKGADDAVRGLRFIWISHIHADHHTGLARILALRRDLLDGVPHEPIIVIGPRQLKRFLDAYGRLEDLDMEFLDCRHTTEASLTALELNQEQSSPEKPSESDSNNVDSTLFAKGSLMQSYWKRPGSPVDNTVAIPLLKKLKKVLGEAGLEVLISFPVIHCAQAFGIALTAADRLNHAGKSVPGWKVVYSGDTRPCPELIKASRGATVLIHEATFEDGMVEEAIARNHSTTSEAIEAGNSAGAYRIILTHFSQRYPKIPVVDESHMHKTCIAFDMMSVNLADLPVLPKILPYLKLLFKNEMVVDELEDDSNAATAAAT